MIARTTWGHAPPRGSDHCTSSTRSARHVTGAVFVRWNGVTGAAWPTHSRTRQYGTGFRTSVAEGRGSVCVAASTSSSPGRYRFQRTVVEQHSAALTSTRRGMRGYRRRLVAAARDAGASPRCVGPATGITHLPGLQHCHRLWPPHDLVIERCSHCIRPRPAGDARIPE